MPYRRPKRSRRVGPARKKTRRGRRQLAKKKKVIRKAKKVVKNMVEKVLECKDNKGTYTKQYAGDQVFTNTASNHQTVWGNFKRGGANTSPATSAALSFDPFQMFRLLDAVSVLYNNKTKALNYEATTGNFANSGKGIVADFTYASYTLTLKNCHRVAVNIDCYMGKARNNGFDDVLTLWDNSYNSMPYRQTAPVKTTWGQKPTGRVDVTDNFNLKHKRFSLKPGESKTLYTHFKGCVDFDKYKVAGTLAEFGKGISESWCFIVRPVMGVENHLGGIPYGVVGQTNGQTEFEGVSIKVKEVYKVIQPDATLDDYEGNAIVDFTDLPRTNANNNVFSILPREKMFDLQYV